MSFASYPRDSTVWVALAALCLALDASAVPFLPTDDAQVLEQLPARNTPQYRQLKSLQAAAAQAPADPGLATRLATAYIRASRLEGDPRFLGYAQAALSPWWKDPKAPTPVLVLRATILQSSHQFDAALTDLALVMQREPRNAQAALTTATVLTVQGKYAQAREACRKLSDVAPDVYRAICIAGVDSMASDAWRAYATLTDALARAPRADAAARVWGETLAGEIAHRLQYPAAESHFKTALNAGERDNYLLGAYADWLLDQGRATEVVSLLGGETRVDALLLRLALAQRASRDPGAAASIAMLRERFEASHARGDTVHQRENARFELFLGSGATAALPYALANWQVQREAADLRILAEAAAAAHDAKTLAVAQQWMDESGLEYPAVARMLESARSPK